MTQLFLNTHAAFPLFFPLVVFVFGACVGSFLNVCIYRLASGESIVRPGSHCACGKPIAWYDNIPILSWFLLRGKARCCGRRFGFRYPLVEALTGAVFLLIFYRYAPALWVPLWIFSALMLVGGFIDFDTLHLPDCVTVGGTIVGTALAFAVPALHGVSPDAPFLAQSLRSGLLAMTGAIAGAGVVVWIREIGTLLFRREAMGTGDIVLTGCIGAFCGWQGALFAVFGGSVLGALVLLPWLAFAKVRGKSAEAAVPFGPWLALGGLVYVLAARAGVDAYFANAQSLLFP